MFSYNPTFYNIFRLLEAACVLFLATFSKCDIFSIEDEFTVERINVQYEEVTTYYVNNTIEYVLVFPQTKVSIYNSKKLSIFHSFLNISKIFNSRAKIPYIK